MKSKLGIISGLVLLLLVAGGVYWYANKTRSAPSPLLFGRALLGKDRKNEAAIVHFIVRGSDIFVDANKDDIPQPTELSVSKELPLIADEKAGVEYHAKEFRLSVLPEFVSEKLPQQLALTCDISGKVNYQQLGEITLTIDPTQPDWIHFHGPTRIVFPDLDLPLSPGQSSKLLVWIGNNAIGPVPGSREITPVANSSKLNSVQSNRSDSQLDETVRFANLIPVSGAPVPKLTFVIPLTDGVYEETFKLDDFC